MKVEKIHNKLRYTLSNEDLRKGDKRYPIALGRCLTDKDNKMNGGWILHNFDFRDFMCGFPDEPHIIINTNYSEYKPYQVQTNLGFGPIESYYKIIKIEKQVKEDANLFPGYRWIEEKIK